MMKNFLRSLLALLFIGMCFSKETKASHALGAEITYECLGGDQYRIRLVFYRDCGGISAPGSASIAITSSCGNVNVPMAMLPPEPAFPPFDQYLAPYELPVYCQTSNCSGGGFPGIQEYVYEGTATLPPCANWTMSYNLCCRSASINTISSPGSQDIYVNAFLNNVAAPCNSSPQFDVPARGFLCLNDDNTIIATATDPDGDLLVYTLYTPLDALGNPVNYTGGYNANNPLNNTGGFNFNNGTIDVFPTNNGQITVVGVMVEEYRNGVLIGRVMRDMQIRVIDNCPSNPGNNFDINQDGVFDSDTIVLCADNPVQLDVYLDDMVAGNNYTLVTENLADFPGATFNTIPDPGFAGGVIGHFNWTPPANAIGTNQVLIFTAFDDNCPVVGFANFTYEFIITGLELNVDIDTVAISCTDSVQMNTIVTNGAPPYTYLWNDGTTGASRWVTAGEYIVVVTDDEGCTGDDTINVFYIDDPVSLFDPSNGCVDSVINFVDQSYSNYPAGFPPITIVDWHWDFGDNTTLSGVPSPSHTYTSPGDYTVQLIVTNDLTCTDTIEHVVWANPAPDVGFTFENVCQDTLFTFTDQSTIDTGQIVLWAWDFGEVLPPTFPVQAQNTTHQFGGPGPFNVTLLAVSDSACPAYLTQEVYVFPLPVADFSPTDVCHLNASSFMDLSVVSAGNVEQWDWDYGDLTPNGTIQNPVHTYQDTGVFNVTLIVTTDSICRDTVSHAVTVHPSPVAGFTNDTVCAELVMTFTDTSTIGSGTIMSWDWNFGDGSPHSTDQNPTHIYATGGTYTVSLVIESALGCTDSIARTVIVYPKPNASFSNFAACLNEENQFYDQSTVAVGSQVVGWDWSFGDVPLGTSLDQNPTYVYSSVDVFYVTLICETNFGCLDTITNATEVYDLPVADFTFSDVCLYDAGVFINTSTIPSGSISGNFWDFGNDSTSAIQQPFGQVYQTAGFYDVELITESNNGCMDTVVQAIEIFPIPTAMFSYDSVCYPYATTFTNLSSVGGGVYIVNDWVWKFGDTFNTQDVIEHPTFAYDVWGDYTVQLTVTTDAGCVADTALGPVRVYPKPAADFSNEIANCYRDTSYFIDLSTLENAPEDFITDWNWDFADILTDTNQNTFHIYSSAGFFNAELAVTTNHGCQDTVYRLVEVYPLPDVKFTVDTNFGCQPFRALFTDLTEIPVPYILDTWEWDFGDGNEPVSAQHPIHTYLNDTLPDNSIGVYTVSLRVTSANGCVEDTVYENYMTEYPKPDALFSVDPQRTDILFPKVRITDLASPNVESWFYELGDGSTSFNQNPVHEYSDTLHYTIVQYVTTEFGCLDTAEFTVIIDPEFTFYIPTAFSPNADDKNEEFYGSGIGIKSYNMLVFDRWGEMIFESNDYDYHWDGTYRGTQVQEGVYTYRFNLWDVKGEPHIYDGHVTLFR